MDPDEAEALLARWQPRLVNWARWCRQGGIPSGEAAISALWDGYRSPQVWEPDPLPRLPANPVDAERVQRLYAALPAIERAVVRVWWHDPPLPKADRPRAVMVYLCSWGAYQPFREDALPAIRLRALQGLDNADGRVSKSRQSNVGGLVRPLET